MEIFKIFLALLFSYIIGSISLGYIFGKIKGIDLRKKGPNKNIGTSNVKYVLGLKYAIPTAIWDIVKGIIAVIIGISLNLSIFFICLCGIFAILGHCFPFYLNFKGGKGAATAYGLIIFGLVSIIISNFPKIYIYLIIWALLSLSFLFFTKAKNLTAIIATLFLILFFPKDNSNIWILFTGFIWLSLLAIIAIKEKGWRA